MSAVSARAPVAVLHRGRTRPLGALISRRRVLAMTGLLVLAVLAATSLLRPGTAAANGPANWYELHARHSDKCLRVDGGSTAHAADVRQYGCQLINDQWKTVHVGDGYYNIVARHSGKCLDVAHGGMFHMANVLQADCWGGYNQQWRFVPTGKRYTYQVIARHSGKCLDVAHMSIASGADVIQGDCWYAGGEPAYNQQWTFVYMGTGTP